MKKKILSIVLSLLIAACCAAPARGATVLEVGSRGSDVIKVQNKLIQWDYLSGTADGRYGEATRNAVLRFQRNNGLTADGRVGPATAAAMGVTLSGSSSSSSAATTASSSTSYVSSDHRLLAKLVYAEARGESYKGQVAVAAVVLNRVKHDAFPNTISGVIFQTGAFDAVWDGQFDMEPTESARRAARDALGGWDPTGGCIYYYNPRTATNSWIWTRQVQLTIGQHAFAI